jgi:hypothetical protein
MGGTMVDGQHVERQRKVESGYRQFTPVTLPHSGTSSPTECPHQQVAMVDPDRPGETAQAGQAERNGPPDTLCNLAKSARRFSIQQDLAVITEVETV